MTFVRTYDSATANRGPLRHLVSMLGYPMLVWRHRFMVHNFFRRDLLGRVNGSFLGVGWLLLQPMFLFAVYYFVFGVIFADRNKSGADKLEYALYLFSGIIAWQSFIEATSTSCSLIVDNGNLVKKVAFPSEVLFVHVVMTSMVIYLVGAVVCLATSLVTGVGQPGWLLAAMPLVLVAQALLCLGIGLLLANLYVFVRDIVQLWRIVSQAWMFVTPIFWEPKLLAGALSPEAVDAMMCANPAYPLIQAHRLALGGPPAMLGDFWSHLGIAAAWGAGFFVLGYCTFMSRKHKYADLI
jgi:lipopolysaccharide transport system permease protein